MKNIDRNLTMLCDFYELTMANGYEKCGLGDTYVYFDVFYRDNPDNAGYAIAAGLEQIVNYINDLHFDTEDIEYLRSKGIFDEKFLEYLKNFRFEGLSPCAPKRRRLSLSKHMCLCSSTISPA